MMAAGRTRRWRGWLIRVAGSAMLLAVLFRLVPWADFAQAVRNVAPATFALVLAAFLLCHVAAAAKFWWLLDRRLPFVLALRAHFAGLAANLGLPGAIGGDAVRMAMAHLALRDGARVVAGAAADRLIDLAALGTLTLAGLALAGAADNARDTAIVALACLAAAALGVAFLPRLLPLPWRIFPALPGRGAAERLGAAFAELGETPLRLAAMFLLSLAIQGALLALALALALAAGLQIGAAPWLFAWPLAKILAVLPVSLNGLGLRESVLAALLAPFGAAAAVVVAAGLLWQAVLFCAGAVGGLVWMTLKGDMKAPQATEIGR